MLRPMAEQTTAAQMLAAGLEVAREEIPVRFAGPGAGEGDLSWGQRELWRLMCRRRTWMPIGAHQPLPAGTTLDDVVSQLRFVMSRYPTMRTRLRVDGDEARQFVASAGQTTLEVVDAADDADPNRVAVLVWMRNADRDYDFASDWPVRMSVVRHRGKLTHRVWVICHLATDGGGARVLLNELDDRDNCRGASPMPPLEQARWQRSPAGQRRSQAALRYWEQVLRQVSPHRFPARSQRPSPRYWQGQLTAPAMRLAVRRIAARTGLETSAVLLTLFAVSLARITGIDPVVTQVTVGNRFHPGLARTVSPIMQSGLLVLDASDATIDEAVSRTRRHAMAAYKNAYCDPDRREELIAQVTAERGDGLDIDCTFNDWWPPAETGEPPTVEQIEQVRHDGGFQWHYKQDEVRFSHLFVNVDNVPGMLQMTVTTDIHCISPDDVEACLRGMTDIAVAAALDPATRTGLPGRTGD